jgi:hypothetical protein
MVSAARRLVALGAGTLGRRFGFRRPHPVPFLDMLGHIQSRRPDLNRGPFIANVILEPSLGQLGAILSRELG